MESHAQLVYNLALRLVGNPADAEDLAQDSLLRALRGLGSFRGDSSLSTWLYRITVNTWKNRVRSEKRRGLWRMVSLNLFTGQDHDEEPAFVAPDKPADSGLEASERDSAVRKALLELDEEARAVIVLREIEGQSYEEIASALEIPVGTIKSRLSRARQALKNRLMRQVQP